jgi:hypothetical protein
MTNYVHVIKDSYHQRVAPILDSEESLFEPAPCDECESYYYCEHYETACKDFAYYVRTGKILNEDRSTSTIIYNRLFKRKKHVRT